MSTRSLCAKIYSACKLNLNSRLDHPHFDVDTDEASKTSADAPFDKGLPRVPLVEVRCERSSVRSSERPSVKADWSMVGSSERFSEKVGRRFSRNLSFGKVQSSTGQCTRMCADFLKLKII